jgi:uncharacterized protein YyaL (SSP411 family)
MYKFDFTFSPKAEGVRQINWYHYREGLQKASNENKLALLVISAAWCYWCHVLDDTTLSQEEIIRKLNNELVAIRADADFEPDIEARYAQEGLPSVIILSPHGITLGGGNFFTAQELNSLINEAQHFYNTQRLYYFQRKEEFEKNLQKIRTTPSETSEKFDPESLIKEVIIEAVTSLDADEPGFAGEVKFPHPQMLSFLLSYAEFEGEEELLEMPFEILDTVIESLLDKDEGGFYRYARSQDWTNPQTDKHLYDNALLLDTLAKAYHLSGNENYLKAAESTLKFLREKLKSNNKLYGLCQDATEEISINDSRKELTPEPPRVVLKQVTAYNARLAASLTELYRVTNRSEYLEEAEIIINALLDEPHFDPYFQLPERSAITTDFFLQDAAEFINALLALGSIEGKQEYLDKAASLYQASKRHFFDDVKLLFKDRVEKPDDIGALTLRYHPLAENCLLAESIFKLSLKGILKQKEEKVAARILNTFANEMQQLGPFAAPIGLAALAALKTREAN